MKLTCTIKNRLCILPLLIVASGFDVVLLLTEAVSDETALAVE